MSTPSISRTSLRIRIPPSRLRKSSSGYFLSSTSSATAISILSVSLCAYLKRCAVNFAEFGGRTVIPVTTRRRDWRPESETVLLDFSTTFVRFLIETVTSPEFGGAYGVFDNPAMPDFFSVFLARYQNDQGRSQGERLIIINRESDGRFEEGNRVIHALLEGPQLA
jgi:hypothetical protein